MTLSRRSSGAGKWLGLVTAVWVQSVSGNNYTFSNYSSALKSLMSLTQLQLNSLSVAKDAGKAFGLVAGLASDRLPTAVILLIGAAEGLVGYGVQWLVVSRRISPLPYWQMCIFLCLGGNSTTWMNTAVLVTCMRNFRRNRGPVSGILKGFVGLSTAIFTAVASALFPDDPAAFLLMLALAPLAVCLSAALFLRESPPATAADDEEEDAGFFGIINVVAVVVAVYLLAYGFVGGGGVAVSAAFSAVLLLLLASPAVIPVYAFLNRVGSTRSGSEPGRDAEARMSDPLLAREKAAAGPPVIGEDHTILEAMGTVEFWLLFVSFLCGVGTGLAVMNNMSQMGLALGYTDVSVFVSLTSIFGFFGQILSGTGSEYLIKKGATPRPLWNAASQILMVVGYALMAMVVPGSLYIGSIVVGICYGVRLAVTVPTASELFGLKYYGLIYNILILNLPLGSFIFSGLLAGLLYDAQATAMPGGGNTCVGAHCFRMVYSVMAAACVVGFGLDVVLSMRTRGVYAEIHGGKKHRKLSEGGEGK